MKLSERVGPHLPYLRRFARALTGSQKSGDAYVAALLESIVADPSIVTESRNMRVTLYHGLCAMWSSLAINERPDHAQPAWEATVQGRLVNMSGRARQVYLLSAIEGFEFEDIAAIQGIELEDVAKLHQSATQQISEMIASDVLIIEDEPLIAMDIEDLVTSLGHRVLGIARTHREAIKMAAERKPQLVLSDIQLADGSSGIDAVNDILKEFDVPVIFITAFPERLLTGERPEPAFLITKPFSPDMVKGVISQALFFEVNSRQAA
jgi:CheY-like chemotaxis protein/DNA-directed RNA polymerase specialized sigma24 family protein